MNDLRKLLAKKRQLSILLEIRNSLCKKEAEEVFFGFVSDDYPEPDLLDEEYFPKVYIPTIEDNDGVTHEVYYLNDVLAILGIREHYSPSRPTHAPLKKYCDSGKLRRFKYYNNSYAYSKTDVDKLAKTIKRKEKKSPAWKLKE
jgi:hypothetical protein